MCSTRGFASLLAAVLLLQSLLALIYAQRSTSRWQTLNGNPPLVVARGGFSGLFPDSSSAAYQFAMFTSLRNVILWCDVQLTKDNLGICAPDLRLENSTDIAQIFPNMEKTYLVNGVPIKGWFPVDFTYNNLSSVALMQGVYSRSERFDGGYGILTPQDVAALKPSGLWLNIEHDVFFTQHRLNMRSYILSVSRSMVVNYVSSPEVGFLRSIASRFNPNITKLVFRFLELNAVEPSTKQTYRSLLGNLTFIKTFASGILIPKDNIWTTDGNSYLESHTAIVSVAHKVGLEVFASGFYNDVPLSYNYSYDPVTEYLYFINNGNFSVDGVLSDFPITPSEAIDCFSHLGNNASKQVEFLVISNNGASGDYPGCTNLAYQKAISDGADVIDCPVQMSKDGIPFCLGSINLMDSTTDALSRFSNLAKKIPELQAGTGIYTFSMNWSQIQDLTPVISNPYSKFLLLRNPKFRNEGKFLTLSNFLALAKNASSLSGVLINIEHAAYLIEKQQLRVTDAVLDVLREAGFAKRVMIQSSNSSVLTKLKDKGNYELVYKVDENIRDALEATVDDIKTFAHSVVVTKDSVFPVNLLFLTSSTNIVQRLQSSNLSVYVATFNNEFVSQAWDFLSDATVEINSFVKGAKINGVITDYPKTSARYRRNKCLRSGKNVPSYMTPIGPGDLLNIIAPSALPPAEAPNPVLKVSDVAEPPLPSGASPSNQGNGAAAEAPAPRNGQRKIAACIFLSNLAMLFTILSLL